MIARRIYPTKRILLALPEESYIAGQMPVIDVDAIHHVREFVRKSLADAIALRISTPVCDIYHSDESGTFRRRRRRRTPPEKLLFSYLSTLESPESYQLAEKQFYSAGNMTDQIAALSSIVNSQHPAKARSLDSFYQQWRQEALVIDKWFALQATSSMPNTFAVVQNLNAASGVRHENPESGQGAHRRVQPSPIPCIFTPKTARATGF